MRVAILGSGNQARIHARALSKISGVTLVGVGARTEQRAVEFAQRWSIRVCSPEELIKGRDADAIVIATPTSTHAHLACAAFSHGKHVFCESPLAHTLAEADMMLTAARRADRILQVGVISRFEPPFEHLASSIRSGELGRVYAVEARRFSAHWANGSRKSHYGDAIEELLTFDLHFLNWAFGRPESISARAVDLEGQSRHVVATVVYPGFLASCVSSTFMPAAFPFTEALRLFTDEGLVDLSLQLTESGPIWTYEVLQGSGPAQPIAVTQIDPTIAQMRHFVECASGQVHANRADGIVGREMLELTLSAAASARKGRSIRLS